MKCKEFCPKRKDYQCCKDCNIECELNPICRLQKIEYSQCENKGDKK